MANVLTVEHAHAGQHIQLQTLNAPAQCLVVRVGGRLALALAQGEGVHVELKTSGGTLPAVTVPLIGPRTHHVLASSGLGDGQSVQLETPMGTLTATGWDAEKGEQLAGDEPAVDHVDPISELAGGGELPPPTRP